MGSDGLREILQAQVRPVTRPACRGTAHPASQHPCNRLHARLVDSSKFTRKITCKIVKKVTHPYIAAARLPRTFQSNPSKDGPNAPDSNYSILNLRNMLALFWSAVTLLGITCWGYLTFSPLIASPLRATRPGQLRRYPTSPLGFRRRAG
ncbi:hypothetical protein [Azospirillum argentinense]